MEVAPEKIGLPVSQGGGGAAMVSSVHSLTHSLTHKDDHTWTHSVEKVHYGGEN